MKTVRLTDEAFEVIAAALEELGIGKMMLIDFFSGRYGLQSDQVKAETEAMTRLTAAALEFHGISAWRSNGVRTMPAGSVFEPPGKDG